MAITFIDYTNEVLRRFGNQTVDSATFADTRDPQVVSAKNSVQDALNEINSYEYRWPFNMTSADFTCVAGQQEYPVPTSAQEVHMQSFFLVNTPALNVNSKQLEEITFGFWLDNLAERDGDATSGDYDVPSMVFRYPSGTIGFSSIPDQAYTIKYYYDAYPTNLTNATDTVRVPDSYKQVIVNGACKYMSMKRDNASMTQLYEQQFVKGIARMRTILINNYDRIYDTRVPRNRNSSRGYARVS